jgi:nucleoside-diphosphate-sugar epimerase
MSHVLLLGGSGFLGRQVRQVLGRDQRVERLTCPGRDRCDLLDAPVDELATLVRELSPTAVVACTGRLDGDGGELVQTNTLVTAKLLDALSQAGSRARSQAGATGRGAPIRFVRLGSAGEYGPVPHGRAVTERDPPRPVSEYGLSHLAATGLVELAAAAGRVDGLTLRVFNPLGPGMGEQNLLGRTAARLRNALARQSNGITLGPLAAVRDFVDARDVAAAVAAAVFTPDPPARVLNVGSGCAVLVRDAVRMLAQAAGFTGEIREQDAAPSRSATVDWMRADITRAAEVLGWRPVYELADSVKAVWADAMRASVDGQS